MNLLLSNQSNQKEKRKKELSGLIYIPKPEALKWRDREKLKNDAGRNLHSSTFNGYIPRKAALANPQVLLQWPAIPTL